ncbi:probable xyloglucan endotransglucosylase/hydrolase protein 8 [Rhododendron vialii]|uniref:probable xyloglucan endotransglucosylase/hydrolase protein 8 n=1 Tax=Rhododendron vialii TaxID=182163 RepID=UPI00265E359E|nr:probable xyloglucan endotransglucosylase/hydrolase protein 8 [Rhododendron vialii]
MAMATLFSVAALVAASFLLSVSKVQTTQTSLFPSDFTQNWAPQMFGTSQNGQIWSLSLINATGSGYLTNNKYQFGWFSMKIKLAGSNAAGVVTTYFMCSENGAGPTRDEVDFEFLGNVSGQPYILQTNVFKNGTGGREMRHFLWFDPTADFHAYSVLWNNHQLVFFVDETPIRVLTNTDYTNNFFPNTKPMYLFSSIWCGDTWATEGGLVKTNWTYAPFVSYYTDFYVDACEWVDPSPACLSTTTQNWWDQSGAWQLTASQQEDYNWVQKNFLVYYYCLDTVRYPPPTMPEECSSNTIQYGNQYY